MLSWFQALMPKEESFFEQFSKHAQTVVSGAEALRDLLKGGDDVTHFCNVIMQHEHEADAITRDVLLAVRRSFITPFDRSDIKDLITSLDDAIDQMQKTAKVILLYEVKTFDAPMQRIGDIIVQAANLSAEAMPLLRKVGANVANLHRVTEKITKIEEQADHIHDEGLKQLFHAHRASDPMAFIIGTEIYGHLEKVVDRFEDVANRINGIVIEHV